jgi:hypothetical protein
MKFWVYLNGEVPGCFTPADLAKLEGFSGITLVCPAEAEALEKNWRHAEEFPDIMPALQGLTAQKPAPAPETPAPLDVDKLLDSASHRLFDHVADLMKELERHREEKALAIGELEASRRQYEDRIQSFESAARERDQASAELRIQLEKAKNELEDTRRKINETANDLIIRNHLVEKLSHDLAEKEASLAKALSLLRKLAEDLDTIHLDATSGHREQILALIEGEVEPPAALPVAQSERAAYTTDEPPKLPEVIVPPLPEQPAARSTLVGFLKKVISSPDA